MKTILLPLLATLSGLLRNRAVLHLEILALRQQLATNLMNDVGNVPLDIVIKMVAANGKPVAKISDEPNKSMCEDLGYLRYLATQYGIDPSLVKISK